MDGGISPEQINALANKLMTDWMKGDAVPYEIRKQLEAAIAEKMRYSNGWEAVAAAIAARFAERKGEIADKFVEHAIKRLSNSF